jgi:hypothetical protein
MVFNSSHRSRRTSPSTLFALCRSCVEGRWARRHSTPQERAYLLEVITHRWAAGRSADRMLRVPPTTGAAPRSTSGAIIRGPKIDIEEASPFMDSAEDQDHRGARPSPRVRAPRGVSGRRSDGTATASIRMLTARAMLRHGRDPSTVAEAKQVPRALVELMRAIDSNLSPRHRRAG